MLLVCMQGLFVCSPDWLQLAWRCIWESSTMKSMSLNSAHYYVLLLCSKQEPTITFTDSIKKCFCSSDRNPKFKTVHCFFFFTHKSELGRLFFFSFFDTLHLSRSSSLGQLLFYCLFIYLSRKYIKIFSS